MSDDAVGQAIKDARAHADDCRWLAGHKFAHADDREYFAAKAVEFDRQADMLAEQGKEGKPRSGGAS